MTDSDHAGHDVRQTLEPLADRLREEISRQIEAATAELTSAVARARQEAQEARDGLAAAVAQARADAQPPAPAMVPPTEGEGGTEGDGGTEGGTEGRTEGETEGDNVRLVECIGAIDRAASLGGILDALVDGASQYCGRAGVLIVRGARLKGWRLAGFDGRSSALDLALDDAGVLADAVQTNAIATGDRAPSFASLAPGESCSAFPIAIAGSVVAVLYADNGTPHSGIAVLVAYAARSLEALTTIKAAHALTESPDARSGSGAPAGDEADVAARRYARLLVSEIKLYHEAAVVAGRRERDLMMRLGGEIARSRGLYEQRVPLEVRQRADYFRDELVRTLCDGDGALLEL